MASTSYDLPESKRRCFDEVFTPDKNILSFADIANRKKSNYDLDLSETNTKSEYTPYSINLGKGLLMELKEFRGSRYIGLQRQSSSNETKNRFNFQVEQLGVVKKACEAMLNHISVSNP